MSGLALLSRVPKHHVKTITYTSTGDGAVNAQAAIATVTGRVLVTHLAAYCTTTLVGGGTISLGTVGDVDNLITAMDPTLLLANEIWNDATPGAQTHGDSPIVDQVIGSNLITEVLTTLVSAGVIEFSIYWQPLSIDGNLG